MPAARGGRGGRRRRRALVVAGLGAVSLVQDLAGLDLGTDAQLFPRATARVGLRFGGRMAPGAAGALIALAIALPLSWARGRRAAIAAQFLALGAAILALLALLGYLYRIPGLYVLASAIRMAPISAVGVLALAAGVFVSRPEHGPAGVATAPDLGGKAVRRLLPVVVLLPIVLGWFRIGAERAGFYGTELGVALLVIANSLMLGTAIWVAGAALGRLDRRRSTAEAARLRLLRQERAARAEAERQTRAEVALRRAAEAVSAALTIEEVVSRIAEGALEATDADGVVVKRVDIPQDAVVVIATAGRHVPPVGSRGPYAGSFTEATLAQGRTIAVPVVEAVKQPFSPGLRESCARCRAAVVPLAARGRPIGALTLLRGPERPPFQEDELDRAHAFGDLAALAFLKAQLLEEAERRRDEVVRAAESRARLIRGFSHDVKNPLGAASGQLALLEEGAVGRLEPAQRDAVALARRSLATAISLIDDLVELARAEAGQLTIQPEPTDLARAAAEAAEEYRPQAEASSITLEVQAARGLPLVETDPSRVRQILGNLLSNAVKYTPEGGRITVRAAEREGPGTPGPGRWIGVDVENTGPGIPPDKQEVIFQEFTRLEPGERGGGGLGLAISRQIARALGGELTVESEPGRGATFTLWLPAAGEARGLRAA